MPPETLGAFRIEAELGSGGMGTVYLACADEPCLDISPGDKVAVKVIHPHLQTRNEYLRRFVREGRVGLQVAHPNVVRTLAVDVHEEGSESTHFLVMEYVEGRTLRDLLDEYGSIPEALLREIAGQICAGLVAIHDAGIVHRDLKPENVLITCDHSVRIMDLGVARLVDGDFTLTREGQFAGSLAYASPEQLKGTEVDFAADLYSFGVMLFQLATGENPFEKHDLGAIVSAHLGLVPPPARRGKPEISAFLSEVISTLLEKSPEDRFPSTASLLEVLNDAEDAAWWGEREGARQGPPTRIPAVPVTRETELYARESDLEKLGEAWRDALAGDGRVVLVEGEAGIGKTRLVDEFLRTLGDEDCHVLYGSYAPTGGIGGLSSAIVSHFGRRGLEAALLPYLEDLPRLVPAFAAMVVHQAPPDPAEAIDGEAVHAVFCQLMRSLAEEKPLLWVIDDLHFADPDSRRFVLSMARATEARRVLLVCSTRPELPQEEVAELSRLGKFSRIVLGRLGARQVIELLRDAFRSGGLAERLGGKIAFKSDGIPFFVFEMIRELRDRKLIGLLPDGSYVETRVIEEIEVPTAVRDLVEARLAALTREERAILDVGAVQGFEFDPDLIARVLRMKRISVLQVLAEIERTSGVVRGEAAHCRFDHHQIQEVILEDLLPQLCDEYHTEIAVSLCERLGVEPGDLSRLQGEDARFLATHHLRGRDPTLGLPFLEPALTHFMELYRNEAALDLVDRALDTPGLLAGAVRAENLLKKAALLSILGRVGSEQAALEEALGIADETGNCGLMAEARLRLGACFQRASSYSEAMTLFREVLTIAAREDLFKLQASAKGSLGVISLYQGNRDEALEHFAEANRIYRGVGDEAGEARVSLSLGNLMFDQGRFDEARVFYELPATSEDLGGLRIMAVGNVGGTYEAQGRLADAFMRYETQLRLSHEIGYRHGEAISLVNLGALFVSLGDVEGARKHLDGCLSLCRLIGSRRVEGYALQGLALASAGTGDHGEAERLFEDALRLRREIGYARGVAETLVAYGRCLSARGEAERARQLLEESLLLAEELGLPNDAVRAGALLAVIPGGDVEEARMLSSKYGERAWHQAQMEARFLEFRASGSSDQLMKAHGLFVYLRDHAPEEYRETMIPNVPLHRDIMAAWQEHGGHQVT